MSSEPDSPMASIVVTCKGRLHHLRKTMSAMLGQKVDFSYEIIVVDYGCPQGTFQWCVELDHRQIVAVRVLADTDEFSRSRSHNCGARQAQGRVIGFVDADIRLHHDWLSAAAGPILRAEAGFTTIAWLRNGWDCKGTWAVDAAIFHRVRGYDEMLKGWGAEDSDLYDRCGRIAQHQSFSSGLLAAIKHSDDDRVRFHDKKSIYESCRMNADYLAGRTEINPREYGAAPVELHRGLGIEFPPVFAWPERHRTPFRVSRHARSC